MRSTQALVEAMTPRARRPPGRLPRRIRGGLIVCADGRHSFDDVIVREKRRLSEDQPLLTIELGGQMALAQESLGSWPVQRDLRCRLAGYLSDQSIAEIVSQLHRHDVLVRPLRSEDQVDTCCACLDP